MAQVSWPERRDLPRPVPEGSDRAWTLTDDPHGVASRERPAELRLCSLTLPVNRPSDVLGQAAALTQEPRQRPQNGGGEGMDDATAGPGHEGRGRPGSDLARLHQEALDWGVVLLGGSTLGPLSPRSLVRTWKSLRGRGLSQRLSAYTIVGRGRTVYLLGPHSGEAPRGLCLEGERVTLCGVDERGGLVSLPGQLSEQVDCYLFVGGRLAG